jgi:putative endonuclease
MPNLRRVGQRAEDEAAEYLVGQGYTVITRRKKMRSGELDIVALDGEVLVFVEVKHRLAPGYSPEDAIGNAKIRALQRAAEQYVCERGEMQREFRFDLIAIDAAGLRHHIDVFR